LLLAARVNPGRSWSGSSWSTPFALWCPRARRSAWLRRASTGTVDWCR